MAINPLTGTLKQTTGIKKNLMQIEPGESETVFNANFIR